MTGNDIYAFLNQKFPIETACDFDNPGFLIGDRSAAVSGVLVALDCDRYAVQSAIDQGCQLIVTHHPVIFSGLKSISAESVPFMLIQNGISVISMHTNLDIADGGVNDCLSRVLGLSDIAECVAHDGFVLRRGRLKPVTADQLATDIGQRLGGTVRYTDGGSMIENVLVCSGSGGEFLCEVVPAGCDALITGDVKHHLFIDAVNAGISLFDAGHFNTEDVIVEPLAACLRGEFTSLRVVPYHSGQIRQR